MATSRRPDAATRATLADRRATMPPIDCATLTTMCLTMSDQAIGRQLGVTGDTIRWWRRKWGIPNARPCRKDYAIDETFFSEINTEEKAYILGFIAADGGIVDTKTHSRLTIGLHPQDGALLERMRACLQAEAPIKVYTLGQYPCAVWQVYNRPLVESLRQYGIGPRKSLTLAYPAVPAHLERHYIRGLWDGDGHISRHDIVLKGSLGTTTGVQQAIHAATGCLLRLSPQVNIFALRGSGRDAPAIRWLYEDSAIVLERKQHAYETFWKQGTVVRHSLSAKQMPLFSTNLSS